MSAQCWITDGLERHFALGEAQGRKRVRVLAARGERVSLQACVKWADAGHAEVSASAAWDGPDDLRIRVRRVGCVPVPHQNTGVPAEEVDGLEHIPGYVPDPMFDDLTAVVGPRETQVFWLTVTVPRDAAPGPRRLSVALKVNGKTHRLTAEIAVSEVVLQPRQGFPVTHWFYTDAIADWYQVKPFGKRFWPLCEKYMLNCVEHGQDVIHTPLLTPSTDGVKRPTQLLRIKQKGDTYSFDWTDVLAWVNLARGCGFTHFEWPHLFTQWGVQHAIRVYKDQGAKEKLLWPADTGATSQTYRSFLTQLLPEFERFLRTEGLFDVSFFHVSDEPHGDEHLQNYKAARGLLKELAPWMKTMDALTDIRYGREQLTDMPIPSIATTKQFCDEGVPSWTYFCCGPRGPYLNRLVDTPLPKMRMAGWLFYRFQRLGFLHWGYNYWYRSQSRELIDPFTVLDGRAWPGWAYGDTFLVYPGAEGPIDSIRWEVFAESLQDYALLQTAGVDPNGELLAPLKDFNDFPKTRKWILQAREGLLQGA